MREEEIETAIKVVIVGNGAVGKSSMIQRYCKGIFTRDYKKTIGVDFLERQIEVNNEDVRLMLWDTAGQEEFDAITKAYYRGAQACVVACSTTDRASFEAVKSWKKKVEDEVGQIATVLVQNKIDLLDEAVFSQEEIDSLAEELNLELFKTSVKENHNIEEVFRHLAELYLEEIENPVSDIVPQTTIATTSLFTASGSLNNNSHATKNGNSSNKNKDKHSYDNGTIQLHPTKRRTRGKKAAFTKCALL